MITTKLPPKPQIGSIPGKASIQENWNTTNFESKHMGSEIRRNWQKQGIPHSDYHSRFHRPATPLIARLKQLFSVGNSQTPIRKKDHQKASKGKENPSSYTMGPERKSGIPNKSKCTEKSLAEKVRNPRIAPDVWATEEWIPSTFGSFR